MINKFDKIYYINCEHRKDRRNSIESVLKRLNAEESKVSRIEAIYIPENGSLGCAKSHLIALNDAKDNKYNNFLILEDDFVENDTYQFNRSLAAFFNISIEWDILMLSANLLRQSPTQYRFLLKVEEAQTTSGYAVNSNFIDNIISLFDYSREMLETEFKIEYAIDQNWKKMQSNSNWYAFNPLIGRQIDDWSDIEKKFVSYKC